MKARLALVVGVPAFLVLFAGAIAAGYFMGQTSFRPSVSSSGRVMPAIPSHGGSPPGPEGSPGPAPAGGQSASPADQPGGGEAPLGPATPPAAAPSPQPAPQPIAPASPPPALPGPTATPAIPGPPSRFHVQVGSFADRGGATSLVQQLRDRGYAVTLVEGPPYRVWVGGYLDQATAEKLVANLQAAGFEATLTPR